VKRFLASLLIAIMIASTLLVTPPFAKAEEDSGGSLPSIPANKFDENASPNEFYFVGLFWIPIWANNAGKWTPYRPGEDAGGGYNPFPYSFNIFDQKVKDVEATPFTAAYVQSNPTKWEAVFYESRYRQYSWTEYRNKVSTEFNVKIINDTYDGSTAKLDLQLLSPSMLNAPRPEETVAPGGNPGHIYYFSTLLTIKVYPQLIVKHFTTDGQTLNDVFPNWEKDLTVGQTNNIPVPTNPQYRYVGYKISPAGNNPKSAHKCQPPDNANKTEGGIYLGQPPSITFDDSFNKCIVNLYYEKTSDKPNLVAVDITANGPIEVGKPASFTAKWRLDHKSLLPNQCYNVKVMEGAANLKIERFCGTQQGQQLTMNFTYTFTSTAQKTFRLVVDSANELAETNEDDNQLVKSFKPGSEPPPPVKTFTGDFDVLPPVIDYREPFALKPKNFVFNGCTYDGHRYKIERDGRSNYTSWANGENVVHSYTYSTYPSVIAVGTHTITLEIRTKECGTKQPATHTLVVNGPSKNSPPSFQVAWVYPGTNVPVKQVFEGEVLDLIFIEDPSVPTPYDPDGDPLIWKGFDFSDSSDWAKTIPENAFELYNGWGNIKMTAAGTQIAKGTMCDPWGACDTQTAVVQVVTEDPVPVITGPREVVEDRPVTPPIHGDFSYSPVPGRTIDHSRDIWTNRKTVYTEPGTEIITLEVFDNTGRKSREPAKHYLTVKPDLPPVPMLDYITPSIRNVELTLTDESYSPDGDKIVERRLTYQYDSNNDGNFAGEAVVTLPLNAQNKAKFKPQRVGKYRFTLYVREDWGREASKTYDLEIVNDSPTFGFNVSYEETEPHVSPLVPLPASNLVNNSNWRNMDFTTNNKPKAWGVNPYTGALAHTPENLGVINYSVFTTEYRSSELYTNNILPSSGGFEVKPMGRYYAGVDDIKEVFYITNGEKSCLALNRYTGEKYLITVCGFGSDQKHAQNEWITRVDYKNNFVYTMTISGSYNPNPEFRRYTVDDFLRKDGTYNAVVDAKTAGYAQKRYQTGSITLKLDQASTMTSSYGYFGCTSIYSGNRFLIFGWDGSLLFEGDNQSCPFPNTNISSFRYDHLGYDRFANAIFYSDGQVVRFSGKNASMTVIGRAPQNHTPDIFMEDGVHYFDGYFVYQYPSGTYAPRENVPINSYRDRALMENYLDVRRVIHDAAGYRYGVVPKNGHLSFDVIRVGRDGKTEVLAANLDSGCFHDCNLGVTGSAVVVPMVDGSLFVLPSGTGLYKYMYILEPKQKQDDSFRILESLQQLAGDKDSSNVELNFQIRFNTDMNQNLYSGFSYNIQDRLNMYRVELNTWRIRLVKLVNGHKTVLASVDVNVPLSERQTVKIKRYADKHIIYFNGVPVIDLTDNTYTGGTFGPFSEIFKTEFFNMSYRDLSELGGKNRLQGVGIVGERLQYNTNYSDPENDPRITARTSWTYKHVNPNKFLDAGDGKSGLSAYHNKTYNAEQPVMDKVGVYELSAQTMDDPHPEYLYPRNEFDSYRKSSNTATQTVIIHRRPVSDFDLTVAANGTVVWNDRSYDPDRWLSDTNYSTEATGIDYRATRGILQRKYYYISPSGVLSETKLVTPTETGWYTVGMAVKDEYDAWSTYTEKMIYIGKLPAPNDPPVAAFTATPATTYRGVPVTIDSQSWDKEDGGRENLKHTYYLKNLTTGGPETVASSVRTTWTKTFSTLGTFQLRLLVEDSLGQPAEAVRTVTIVNRKPQANVTTPASADPAKPTKFDVLRPTFVWTYSDADGDAQTQYQVQIYRTNGTLERDTGVRSGSAKNWAPTVDLPERVTMYVRVRVHDGYDWSDWSAPKYFYIETNRPPTGDFTWTPNPVYEGDTVNFKAQVSDPDNDTLTVSFKITSPSGQAQSYSYQVAPPYTNQPGPSVDMLLVGSWRVEMTVDDGKADPVIVTKTVEVLPLGITAQVTHTDEWNNNRAAFNNWLKEQLDAGKITQAQYNADYRQDSDFWAGERFVLNAQTTVIQPGSNVTATAVWTEVQGSAIPSSPQSPWYLKNNLLNRQLTARNSARNVWYGEVNDPGQDLPNVDKNIKLEQLHNGYLDFTFFVLYSNGTVKQTTVRVNVKDKWTDFYRLHRVQ